MTRGPKKHLKRLNAPKHWMLDKLTGVYAPKPSPGPHKGRESLPLIIFLRNRLHYALTGQEVTKILKQNYIKVDGRVRTDKTFPAGFMDVITIEKTSENFRLIYDVKGRFCVHRITPEEARYKLCRINKLGMGQKGVPYLVTHDARTIRYPNPDIKVNDSCIVDISTGQITEFVHFDTGNLCMITGGHNIGRVGVITSRDKHPGSFDIVHVKDATGAIFATRLANIFVIGRGKQALVSIPRQKGIRITIAEEREKRLGQH
jgi:small subunit ribosomal protein S4e